MTLNKKVNLQLLAHLDALMTERHVSRAAERMGIGQPAMSAALARLREIFRDPLLIKTKRGMEPTPRALELAKRVHQAMALIESASRAQQEFDPATAEAHFRIVASEGVAQLFIPPLMKVIREHAQGVRVTVRQADVRRTSEFLREGEYDLVIAYLNKVPEELHQTVLYPQKVCVIVSRDHPSIQGRISLKQYVAFPHVLWGTEPAPYPTIELVVDAQLAKRGLARTAGIRVPNLLISPAVVAQTDMIATVPDRIAQMASQNLPLQVLTPPLALGASDLSMFWDDRMQNDSAHAWLRMTLREIAIKLKSENASIAR